MCWRSREWLAFIIVFTFGYNTLDIAAMSGISIKVKGFYMVEYDIKLLGVVFNCSQLIALL